MIILFSLSLYTQETEKESDFGIDLGADFMSRYIWRGSQYGGDLPSLQPWTNLSYKNIELGLWGAYSLNFSNVYQEFDTFLSYTFIKDMFTILMTDYYFPSFYADYNYLDYTADSTGHILEATFNFNGTEKIPISILGAVNFYGADAFRLESNPSNSMFNQKIGIQYSTYLELGYSATIKDFELYAFVGGTINKLKEENTSTGFIGEEGFYGTGPGIVNTGFNLTKEIDITPSFSLPVQSSLILNPQSKNIFFVFGLSI